MRRMKELSGDGYTLDIGFSANPNMYLHGAAGIDIALPARIPENYATVARCDLNQESIPFEDETFDAVLAGDVIEHVESPSHFLREVNRVLKDGGKVIISTPQANDWWTTLHNWFFRPFINDPDPGEHLHNWTILDMIRLLKKNGFAIDHMEGQFMRFPFISLRIPVRPFPILSWQIIYIAKKNQKPDTTVLTKVDGQWLNVPKS